MTSTTATTTTTTMTRHGERPNRRSFTSFSASAGALWRLSDEWQASFNYSLAERAPSQAELFADGPHLATFTFEEGDPLLDTETTNGFDLGVHRHGDFFDFEVSVFYNDIDDFVFLAETDEFHDGLPVREAGQADAEFYGGEVAGVWQWRATGYGDFDFSLGYDWVRGRLDRGENLPRISPGRYSAGLDWHLGAARARLDYQHVSSQDDVAPDEAPTASYDMLDLNLGYAFDLGGTELEAFVRGSNLLDEEARVHTSFLKNFAPKPGSQLHVRPARPILNHQVISLGRPVQAGRAHPLDRSGNEQPADPLRRLLGFPGPRAIKPGREAVNFLFRIR